MCFPHSQDNPTVWRPNDLSNGGTVFTEMMALVNQMTPEDREMDLVVNFIKGARTKAKDLEPLAMKYYKRSSRLTQTIPSVA